MTGKISKAGLQRDTIQTTAQKQREEAVKNAGGKRADRSDVSSAGKEDIQVQLRSARAIHEDLSPEKMAGTRQQRVQELAKLVQSGKYFETRSNDEIAQAVAAGIAEQIAIHEELTREENS